MAAACWKKTCAKAPDPGSHLVSSQTKIKQPLRKHEAAVSYRKFFIAF